MRLLHVIGSMNPHTGGPCQTIRNFAPRFLELGNQLEVVCLNEPNSDYLAHDPFPVYAVGQGKGAWNYHPALRPWLDKNLARFDAVILNGLWQFQGMALARATKKHPKPGYYIFPHGMLDPFFQKVSVRRSKAFRNWIYWKLIEQRNVHRANGLLFTSEEEKRLAQIPFKPYRPRRESVVGLGVVQPPLFHAKMRAAFLEKCPGIRESGYWLFLSRIHPKKGIDLLIKAYAQLFASNQSSAGKIPKLVIAGPGLESDYGTEMAQLAGTICPDDSVFWPGMLTGDAKWGALYGCEAFVLPSHQENFGIAVVESLACGRPVIISDQVNIWKEIKNAGASIVNPDSLEGTGRSLQDWIKLSPGTKNQMSTKSKVCYRDFFSVESATDKLIQAVSIV